MKHVARGTENRGRSFNLIFSVISLYAAFFFLTGSYGSMSFGMKEEDESLSSSTHNQTFGSQAVLEGCWSLEELREKDFDRLVSRPSNNVYGKLPSKTVPEHINVALRAELGNSIRRVIPASEKKLIALTFDLCEGPNEVSGYDAEIVNYLRENKIKATFFAGGKWMLSHPEKTMQLMADPLFEIGNHSWSHSNFRLLDSKKMEDQILWTQAQYESLWEELNRKAQAKNIDPSEMSKIPAIPVLFRFPYGTCNFLALDTVNKHGLAAIQWDLVTGDAAKGQTPQAISRVVLQQAKPGSIIICHANGRGHGTSRALPVFVPKLHSLGYSFVTVSELLTCGPAVTSEDCYELRPGDNLRYDRMFGAGSR